MTKQTRNKPPIPGSPLFGEGVGELAQMYDPDRNERSATRLFREEMHLTRGLWDAMVAVGYKPYTKVLTRGQVKTIVRFLGEP